VSFELRASSFKPAWAVAILTLLCPQDPELDAAIKADRARIAAKKPLTRDETKAYRAVAPRLAPDKVRFRIKAIPLSFTDAPATRADLRAALLDTLAAYYRGQSGGVFELESALLDARNAGAARSELAAAAAGSAAEQRIVGRVLKSEDLEGADAFLLVAAGGIGSPKTGLWPHESTIRVGAKSVEYVLMPETGDHRWFGIAAHETGHLLKLEDKYGDREAKVGRWCLMGTGYLDATKEDPRPGPLCAVCREALGWNPPLIHDPPSEGAYSLAPGLAAVKVPVNKDGKEAVVLEFRGRALLVWHTGGGRPIELAAILPTDARDRLTPWSDPPFRARTLGASNVWITDVRVQEGKVWFRLGPSADLTPLEELRKQRVGRELGK